MSMLKGRTLGIIANNSTDEILSLVKGRKADVGVIAGSIDSFRKYHPDLKIIARSGALPQSIVALSPFLKEEDRETIKRVLMSLPKEVRARKQANFGSGVTPSYSSLSRMVQAARAFSACLDGKSEVLVLSCKPGTELVTFDGWIDDFSPSVDKISLAISTTTGDHIILLLNKGLLKEATTFTLLEQLRNKRIRVITQRVIGQKSHTFDVSSPNQLEFLD